MEFMSSAKMRPVVQYYLRKHKSDVRELRLDSRLSRMASPFRVVAVSSPTSPIP